MKDVKFTQETTKPSNSIYSRPLTEHQAAILNFKELPYGIKLMRVDSSSEDLTTASSSHETSHKFTVDWGKRIPTARQMAAADKKAKEMSKRWQYGAASENGYMG